MDVPVTESCKGTEPVALSTVTSPSNSNNNSSYEGKIVIVAHRRDFCIYLEENEITEPVQESGEPVSAELVISSK